MAYNSGDRSKHVKKVNKWAMDMQSSEQMGWLVEQIANFISIRLLCSGAIVTYSWASGR